MAKLDLTIPTLTLSDGKTIPVLGYGLGTANWRGSRLKQQENTSTLEKVKSSISNVLSSSLDQSLVDTVKLAISLGYTHLDGAEGYANEPELGAAIKASAKKREDLFVTTKVVDSLQAGKTVPQALDQSLSSLGLDYVDLYLIHAPNFAKSDAELQAAWRGMEEVHRAGKAKSIGVSNFLPRHTDAILQIATVKPVINQIEFHPYYQHKHNGSHAGFLAYHASHGIVLSPYNPLAPITKSPGGPVDKVLSALAKKYAVSEGDVLLRWCIDLGMVPITTSSKEQRLSDYLRICTFQLTEVEVKDIQEYGAGFFQRNFKQPHLADDDES